LAEEQWSQEDEPSEDLEIELEQEQDAYQHFKQEKSVIINHFSGGIYGTIHSGQGDVNAGGSSAASIFYPVAAEILDKVSQVYVPIPRYQEAAAQLKADHLLFLCGNKRIGKYTTSIKLLSDIKLDSLLEVFPITDPTELSMISIRKNTGYVLDGLRPETADQFGDAFARRLAAKLKEHGSYLIATVNQPMSMEACSFVCSFPPVSLDMLRAHMNYSLDPVELFHIEPLIDTPSVVRLVTEQSQPRDMEQIMHQLAAASRDECSVEEAISALLPNALLRIEDWFLTRKGEEHARTVAYMITLAVYEGMSLSFITRAADDLHRRIAETAATGANAPAAYVFSHTHSELLSETGSLIRKESRTDNGSVEDSNVYFKGAQDAKAVLTCVWHNYIPIRRILPKWMTETARINSLARKCSIKALALFASFDFSYIKLEWLQSAARDRNPQVRLLVVHTLLELSQHKEFLPAVDELLQEWALKNSHSSRWTAAVAYGTPLGANLGVKPVQMLCKLWLTGGTGLNRVVIDSLKQLLRHAKWNPVYAIEVLRPIVNSESMEDKLIITLFDLMYGCDAESLISLFKSKPVRTLFIQVIIQSMNSWDAREAFLRLLERWIRLAQLQALLLKPLDLILCKLVAHNQASSKHLYLLLNRLVDSPDTGTAATEIARALIQFEEGAQ